MRDTQGNAGAQASLSARVWQYSGRSAAKASPVDLQRSPLRATHAQPVVFQPWRPGPTPQQARCSRHAMQVGRRACLGDVSLPDLLGLVKVLLRLLQVAGVRTGRLECYPQREMHLPQLRTSHEQRSAMTYLCI